MGIGLLVSLIVLPGYAAALAQRLRNAQKAAEAANQAKSQFLANMSHEIRTPLNGIIGAAELLKERNLPKDDRYFVDIINRSGTVLLDLINDILDLSKIEANKLQGENRPFDFHRFLNSVVDMMEIQARKKGLRLLCSVDPQIPWKLEGDEHHLKQVLINLLGNAIKFTEEGEVELRCMLAKSGNDSVHVEFSIHDTGIGIPEEDQQRILEPFVQAESQTSRKYGGTGLGTTIARELVEMMGGSLSLESAPGKGSVFRFTLPMGVMEGERATMENLPMAGRSVLALFENDVLATPFTACMQEWSLDVLSARDIPAAEKVLREARCDYSPVAAIVLGESLAGRIDFSLERWRKEGLVAEDVTLIVAAEEASEALAALPPGERVADRRMWIGSEEELFNALRTVRFAADTEEVFVGEREAVSPLEILIADDNATNRLILASMLRNVGHHVTETENGEEFLEAIEQADYDLALLDMHMPDMNGLEVHQLYRFAHAGDETIPFVVITADVTESTRAACEEAGIEHVLSKPVSAGQLFETIEALGIGQSHLVREEEVLFSDLSLEEVPLVDQSKVEELRSLDAGTELVERIMECFNEDAAKILEQMRTVVELQDYHSMKELAHALRGSAANVGVARVQQVAEQWEQMDEMEFMSVGVDQVDELSDLVSESSHLLSVQFGLAKPRPKLRVVS